MQLTVIDTLLTVEPVSAHVGAPPAWTQPALLAGAVARERGMALFQTLSHMLTSVGWVVHRSTQQTVPLSELHATLTRNDAALARMVSLLADGVPQEAEAMLDAWWQCSAPSPDGRSRVALIATLQSAEPNILTAKLRAVGLPQPSWQWLLPQPAQAVTLSTLEMMLNAEVYASVAATLAERTRDSADAVRTMQI